MSWISDVRMKLGALDRSRRSLVRFGRTMGIAFLVLGTLLFFLGAHPTRGLWLGAIGVAFLLLVWFKPEWLRPIRKGWMAFAFAIGWVMSRVLLTVFFLAVITPTGVVMRLLGRDPLGVKAEGESYWILREAGRRAPEDYERLF